MLDHRELPPEEGDLNREAISKGLSPKEQEWLQKDLQAVESGQSSESIVGAAVGNQEAMDFRAQQRGSDEAGKDNEERIQYAADSFDEFLRGKGITEDEYSYGDLYSFIEGGGHLSHNPADPAQVERIKRLTDLHEEWEQSKQGVI